MSFQIGDKVLAFGAGWDPLEVIGQLESNVVLVRTFKGQVFAFKPEELTPAPPRSEPRPSPTVDGCVTCGYHPCACDQQ